MQQLRPILFATSPPDVAAAPVRRARRRRACAWWGWGTLALTLTLGPAAPAQEPAAQEPAAQEPAAQEPATQDGQAQEVTADPVVAPAPVVPPALRWGQNVNSRLQGVSWEGIFQVVFLSLLTLAWIASVDWVNRDSQIHELGYKKWNPLVVFPYIGLAILLLFLPVPYYVRIALLMVAFAATILPYVVTHNRGVEPHETVLTGPWWRHLFAVVLGKFGVKVSDERLADYEKGAPVELLAVGGTDDKQDNVNLLKARQSPGYLVLKDLIAEMAERRTDRVMLDYGPQGVAVRHEIDGVWHNSDPRDRESGDVMLAVMKTLANLNVTERRKKQSGCFGAKHLNRSYMCPLVSQGTQNGERALVTLLTEKTRLTTYDELGMREGLQKEWEELMASDRGLIVFSAMPGDGLTTMMDVSLQETDRLMRDFVAIEEVRHREYEMQNIGVTTYDAAAGETAASVLPKLIRTYPNVYILRDFSDVEAAKTLMNEIADERLIITSIAARDAPEALVRMLQLKIPNKLFAATATAVLYQRLIRKLCPDCKVAYPPAPDILKKLGIPAGKVQQFYRPPKPEEIEKPCLTCRGIGYFGRTGIFELLKVTDPMREILVKQPEADLLRKAVRASQQRSLQEEGVLLVARGDTSLPELMRILKTESK